MPHLFNPRVWCCRPWGASSEFCEPALVLISRSQIGDCRGLLRVLEILQPPVDSGILTLAAEHGPKWEVITHAQACDRHRFGNAWGSIVGFDYGSYRLLR